MSRRFAALLVVAVAVVAAAAGWWAGRSAVVPGALGLAETSIARVGGLATPSRVELPALADRPVRNIVLLVGDGLGLAQAAAARIRNFGADGRFVFERFPVTGLATIHPADGLIAKSDASATALAAGFKTVNGRIGTAPDGRALPSLLERARDRGRPTGIVTTSWIYDATPASFATHVDRRKDYDEIVAQLAAARVDLLIGGGRERFLPRSSGGSRGDGRDLLAEAAASGVAVVGDVAGLAAAGRLPLWALFPGRDLGESGPPELGPLAERALELLDAEARRRGAGFFLLVEEEAIDSAGHRHDLDRLARATLRFDRAVEAAARFAAADGATLVVVVGDHATGGAVVDQRSTADRLVVAWTGDSHSGEPVPVYAYGPGGAQARFTGLFDSTEIHHRLAAALSLGGEQP